MTGAFLLSAFYLFGIIHFVEQVQWRHELSDDSKKAKLNISDLDKQSQPWKNNVKQFSFFRSLYDLFWSVAMQVEASGAWKVEIQVCTGTYLWKQEIFLMHLST